jgi:hypothetical protein
VCFFHSHARLWVHWAPGFPCALCLFEGRCSCETRASLRRDREAAACVLGVLSPPRHRGLPRLRHFILRKSGRPDLRWGRAGEGGAKSTTVTVTPLPNPPPQGGRELERTGPRMLGCLTIEYGSKLFGDPEALADSTVARMSAATSGTSLFRPRISLALMRAALLSGGQASSGFTNYSRVGVLPGLQKGNRAASSSPIQRRWRIAL